MEKTIKIIKEAVARLGSTAYENYIHDNSDKEYWTYMTCKRITEDERMINELQGFLDSFGADYFGTGKWQKFHDWLEKQKEQKPAEWSEEDENMRDNILRVLGAFTGTVECESNPSLSTSYPTYLREIDWLKSLRPHWKPSEEQMESLAYAIQVLNSNPHPKSAKAYQDLQTLYKNIKYGN